MGLVHSLEGGKQFFCHLNLVLEGLVGMVCIIESGKRGFIDDLGLEREVGGFIWIELIQLLDCSEGYGYFGGVSFRWSWFLH